MSDELKLCPFCGSTSITVEDPTQVNDVHVICKDCDARTYFDGIRYAVAGRWNNRPEEDRLQKRVAELEETLRGIVHACAPVKDGALIFAEIAQEMAKDALKGEEHE